MADTRSSDAHIIRCTCATLHVMTFKEFDSPAVEAICEWHAVRKEISVTISTLRNVKFQQWLRDKHKGSRLYAPSNVTQGLIMSIPRG
jgi:hypothetical protein